MNKSSLGNPAVVTNRIGTMPSMVTAKQGHRFDPRQDVWTLHELTNKVRLRFDKMPYLTSDFMAAFKAVLVWYAQNHSIAYLRVVYGRSRHLFLHMTETTGMPVSNLTSVDLLNYKAHNGSIREWRLGSVSAFIKQWHALGYAGIAYDAVALLNQLRIKGPPGNVAVATMDPIAGPFTALEHEALQHGLNGAYAQNRITLADYALGWMFIALGMRPTQYARLKVCDIVQVHKNDGSSTYSVRMPRAKQRGVSCARGQFKDRLLTSQIGKAIFDFAKKVESQFAGILDDPTQAPLFANDLVESGSNPDDCHLQADAIGLRLSVVMSRLNVISERTGEPLKITAKRFRMTIGTRAAEEGHGELVIAELLDHSNTKNVGVYVRSTSAIIDRIDRAVAMQLAPLAQAFAGKLINGPTAASRRDDATSGIRAPTITGTIDPISSCGKDGLCGFLKPIACYTCNSFEPWLDGPHEQVLAYLLVERERLMVTDARIAAINDRTMVAVADVIKRCEVAHAKRSAVCD